MKGRVLLDEKQDVVLTQNAILFVECLIRARSGPYNYEQMDIQVMPSTLKKDALMRIRIRILSGVFMILLVVAF